MNPKTPRRRPPLPYAHAEPLEPRLFLSGTHYVADGLPDTVATDGLLTLRGTERLSIPGDDLHPGQPRPVGRAADILAAEFPRIRGDANSDGNVDLDDFAILRLHFGAADASWSDGDFSRDGRVDLDDFMLLKRHFGHQEHIPLPLDHVALPQAAADGGGPVRRRMQRTQRPQAEALDLPGLTALALG